MMKAFSWWGYCIPPLDFGWENAITFPIESVPDEVKFLARKLGWEGDVRGKDCAKFLIPDEMGFAEGFIWKQDNNGTCFVISPIPLPHLEAIEGF